MKITVLTSRNSWMNRYIDLFINDLKKRNHEVDFRTTQEEITSGDICFMLGVYKLVKKEILVRNKHNLVVHASALPKGKGWAPLTWQILEGKNKIPVSLFEVVEEVDAGDIYLKSFIELDGTELCNEIRKKQAQNAFEMCLQFIDKYPGIINRAEKQQGEETFYAQRNKNSSELDINKSIKEQFNLIRIVDNVDYPAFFRHKGIKYIINIEKSDE